MEPSAIAQRSSRRRYAAYRRGLAGEHRASPGPKGAGHQRGTGHGLGSLLIISWGMLRGLRGTLAVAVLVGSVSASLALLPLYGAKLIFDNVLGEHPLDSRITAWVDLPQDRRSLLVVVVVGMVLAAIIAESASLWSRWQVTRIGRRVQDNVRRRLFAHITRMPLHRLQQLKAGGLAAILRDDAGGCGSVVHQLVYFPSRAIIQLATCLAALAFVDWRLLVIAVALLPPVCLVHWARFRRVHPLFRHIRFARQKLDARMTEVFAGMRVMRAFSRQRSELLAAISEGHVIIRQDVRAWWWLQASDVAWGLLIPMASAILLCYGGARVMSDAEQVRQGLLPAREAFTTGDLVVFAAYLVAVLSPLAALAGGLSSIHMALASVERAQGILEEPLELPDQRGTIQVRPSEVRGGIELRNVVYGYPAASEAADAADQAQRTVINRISVTIRPGETVALVGPSGGGKTTLCNLIARFYDPSEGGILLDGTDLREITIESYRRLLGIVEQDIFLFDGTVADNIAYGCRHASRKDVEAAAKVANAHQFIMALGEGYDTMLGERGVRLSAGQRQRLTIARAVLANPRILILDEATSSLDSESERLIEMSLRSLMEGRTCVVIAHRLSTITHADRILVLEEGRIIEQGTHEQLLAREDGRYRRMVAIQTHMA